MINFFYCDVCGACKSTEAVSIQVWYSERHGDCDHTCCRDIDECEKRAAQIKAGTLTIFGVYHAQTRDNRFQANPDSWVNRSPNDYLEICEVDAGSLEQVLELTNTINHHWGKNVGVRILCDDETRLRSTSVGDVVWDSRARKFYMVDSVGFKELPADKNKFE